MPIDGHRLLRASLLAALALGVAGCESMDKYNPFVEKQTPLPGERTPLFPEGVPGVEFGAPPPQPPNSNIPITPAITDQQPQDSSSAGQPPPPPAVSAPPAGKSKSGEPNDAWAGTR